VKKNSFVMVSLLAALACANLAMGRNPGQYDEEARAEERREKEMRKLEKQYNQREGNMATRMGSGVKQATVDSAAGLVGETAEATRDEAPIVGTLEGARRGTESVLDNTVKGVAKVATLGYGSVDSYEVEEPEKGSDDTTKIKIRIPGT